MSDVVCCVLQFRVKRAGNVRTYVRWVRVGGWMGVRFG